MDVRRRPRPGGEDEVDVEELARFAFGDEAVAGITSFQQGQSGSTFPLTDEEQESIVRGTLEKRLGSDRMWRMIWLWLGITAAVAVAWFVRWPPVSQAFATCVINCGRASCTARRSSALPCPVLY